MIFLNTPRNKGFTLIELLVVISIIGLLSSVVLASVNEARARARDPRRISDLNQIRNALALYYSQNGNYVGTGSGCGSAGAGNGFFNLGSPSYPATIASCLVSAGYLGAEIIDPTGGVTSSPTERYSYMKYHCTLNGELRVFVFAKLETRAQSTTATDGTCSSTADSLYGMNYHVSL